MWRYKLQEDPFTTLSLNNLTIEDKVFCLTNTPLKQKIKTQSGPGAAPPQVAGDLQMQEAPESESEKLGVATGHHKVAGDEPLGSQAPSSSGIGPEGPPPWR